MLGFFKKIIRRLLIFVNGRRFVFCGENVFFDSISSQFSYSTIEIGNNVFIAPQAWFRSDRGRIIIGDDVMFGPRVQIYGGNHIYSTVGNKLNENHKALDYQDPDVIIGNDVWVGGSVIILPGVIIGDGAIIGAGSVVTKDVKPYTINAGNPCVYLKMRFDEMQLQEHIYLREKQEGYE